MDDKPTIAVVTEHLTPFSGGAIRALRSIDAYRRRFKVLVYELVRSSSGIAQPRDEYVVYIYSDPVLRALFKTRLEFVLGLTPNIITRRMIRFVGRPPEAEVRAVISLHEGPDFLRLGSILREEYGARSAALLQLPVFIRDRGRRERIIRAYDMWYSALYPGSIKYLALRTRARLELSVKSSSSVVRLLRSYDMLISVSRSVGFEMGPEWESRVYALDPGIALDEGDLSVVKSLRERRVKSDYIIFGGRIDALKGFIEGLHAFKKISREHPNIKLVATGPLTPSLKERIRRYAREEGISDKLVLAGPVPREERLRLVAEARAMIYPSHMDSYSYAVLESLYLGTPIVAYDIPALRLNFEGAEGLKLVEEGDVESLAVETLNILESKNTSTSLPRKIRSWDDIVREEVSLIEKLVQHP